MADYHQILGVPYGASAAQIKAAYRRLAMKHHPDRNPGDPQAGERFKQVLEAYQALSGHAAHSTFTHYTAAGTAQEPETPKSRDPYFNKSRWRYATPPDPVIYSKKTKIMAGVFSTFLAALAICIPLTLKIFASVNRFNKGKVLYEQGMYSTAIANLENAYLKYGIRNMETARLITKMMTEELGYYGQALEHTETGLRYSNTPADSAWFFYKKGICFKNMTRYPDAKQALQQAVKLQPEWDSALYQLGEIATFAIMDYEAGKHYFAEALRVSPGFVDCYIGKGYCHYQLGAFAQAMQDFTSFLNHSSKNRETGFYLRGMALWKNGDSEAACSDFRKAAELGATGGAEAVGKYCEARDGLTLTDRGFQ